MKIKSILLVVVATLSFAFLIGCVAVPTSDGGVAFEPAPVYVSPPVVYSDPAYVDVYVPGVWRFESGRRVWHEGHHERHHR
jgi:hypothetical protein